MRSPCVCYVRRYTPSSLPHVCQGLPLLGARGKNATGSFYSSSQTSSQGDHFPSAKNEVVIPVAGSVSFTVPASQSIKPPLTGRKHIRRNVHPKGPGASCVEGKLQLHGGIAGVCREASAEALSTKDPNAEMAITVNNTDPNFRM